MPIRRRLAPRALLLALLLPAAAGLPAAEPIRDAMLAAHNRVRADVGVPPLDWSGDLAAAAQDWADRLAQRNDCRMEHSGPGENLYWASPLVWSDGRREPQSVAPEEVVESWAGERRWYDPATDTCAPGKQCGHYTQIVWRTTEAVGCAYRICEDHSQIWVCRYRPPGNVVGRAPY